MIEPGAPTAARVARPGRLRHPGRKAAVDDAAGSASRWRGLLAQLQPRVAVEGDRGAAAWHAHAPRRDFHATDPRAVPTQMRAGNVTPPATLVASAAGLARHSPLPVSSARALVDDRTTLTDAVTADAQALPPPGACCHATVGRSPRRRPRRGPTGSTTPALAYTTQPVAPASRTSCPATSCATTASPEEIRRRRSTGLPSGAGPRAAYRPPSHEASSTPRASRRAGPPAPRRRRRRS
jgi:hypothetical protein